MSRQTPALSARLLGWWLAPLPAVRLALLRVAIGSFALVYTTVRAPNLVSVAEFAPSRFDPVGLAALLPAPLPAWLLELSVGLTLLSALAFTLGWRFRRSGPVFALLLLAVTSYRNSWGMIFHTENLLVLHVLLLAGSPASDRLSWDARAARDGSRGDDAAGDGRYGWPVRAMSLVTVVAYVVAGIAKLKLSGGTWLGGELLRAQIAYDNLRKLELGTSVSPLGPWLVRHPPLFPALAGLTMLVELGAPLALLGRRVTWAWVAAAWAFHLGVLLMMSIAFVYQLSGFAYLAFFPLERWLSRSAWLSRRSELAPAAPTSAARRD